MVCMEIEPGEAGWKAQMSPLRYVGTPSKCYYILKCFKNASPSKTVFFFFKINLMTNPLKAFQGFQVLYILKVHMRLLRIDIATERVM